MCPFHEDDGAKKKVSCAKRKLFHRDDESADVVRRLKAWALAGRSKTSRATPKSSSHVHGQKWKDIAKHDDETLEGMLKLAREDVEGGHAEWIQASAENDDEGKSDGDSDSDSNSDSSSSSSSDSSS